MDDGYICWIKSQVMEEIRIPIASGIKPPPMNTLEEHGPYGKDDGWSTQASVVMAFLQDGGNLEYKTPSKGGRIALMKLAKEWGQKAPMHLDEDGKKMLPVCELGSESFYIVDNENKNKKYKKYAPTFTIVDWITDAQMTVLLNMQEEATEGDVVNEAMKDAKKSGKEEDDSDDAKPKKKKKKKNKSEGPSDRKSRY